MTAYVSEARTVLNVGQTTPHLVQCLAWNDKLSDSPVEDRFIVLEQIDGFEVIFDDFTHECT